ncbi:hypothetical protein CERZMDRAFT_47642 [Cercospora zeae-maydis SCOH1-5]|uniref:Uncharacterized protein n=1 Tax=Cercospora zeae-maydis SCOH1-5 TaxID=717836 RepID=A0A6A6F642_9PEZI|nr:hypothetical protein CERZMDRAFT_47642 [Cercospora zeae-maydis SCOH1-5]
MPSFFTGWATWEQLVFILACAIVVTVLLGCVKVVHTHYTLRTYNAIAERDKIEGAMHRQMSQRSRLQTSHDIPFGIRAMESGIQVDGVWVSRSNTPEPPSSRGTSASSRCLASRPTSSIDSSASGGSNRFSTYPLGRNNSGGAASISAPDLIALPARQRQQSLDLDLMQTHRMSQAAETGQFAPRVRQKDLGGSWTKSRPSSAANSARHSLRLRARSESPIARPGAKAQDPAEHHEYHAAIQSLPEAARRTTLPDVTPFAQFSRQPAQRYSLQPSSEKRESSILRGQGSGFEILKPGTFAAERQRSGPPISLYNNGMPHARPNSTDSPRKLQKKRRSSEESSVSGRSWLSML